MKVKGANQNGKELISQDECPREGIREGGRNVHIVCPIYCAALCIQ